MAVAREGKERWELRLGAAHAVTWLGLALGTAVGAYFVGFFSGRYVGFDTARSATVSEVAKLTIQDELFDKQLDGEATDIYSRLGSSTGDGSSKDGSGLADKSGAPSAGTTRAAKGKAEEPNTATKFAQALKDENDVNSKLALNTTGTTSAGTAAASEIDALFDEENSKVDSLPEGGKVPLPDSDSVAAELGVLKGAKKGVRVLGEEGSASEASLAEPPLQQDTSLGAILEERVAKARSAQVEPTVVTPAGDEKSEPPSKVTKPSNQDPPTAKGVAAVSPGKLDAKIESPRKVENEGASKEGSTSTSTQGMVKQVLPAGFFAQVAAPKRLQEAQDVARRLKRSGFPVVIETAHVRGEDYFRVLVGPEDTKVQAERLVEQLKRETYLSGTAFLRKVK